MILCEVSVELGSDEHGFVIEGVTPALDTSPAIPHNTLMKWWGDDEPDFVNFVVSTGSQWGPFAVLVKVHDSEPGPVEQYWQDVVAVSVIAGHELVIGEIVDGPHGQVKTSVGPHRMRVCARGRSESAARDQVIPDDDETDDVHEIALEHYLVELWPAASERAAVLRETSDYAREQVDPSVPTHPPEHERGLDAAWAIVRDLQGASGARQIPGAPTTITVVAELAGTPAKLFNRIKYVFGWPPCNGGMGSPEPGATAYHDATLPEYDRYAQVGHIATTLIEATKPKRIVKRWNWVLPGTGAVVNRPLLLTDDSTVTITIASISGAGDDPRCLVRLVHDGAPGAWGRDLEHLWRWHLIASASRP